MVDSEQVLEQLLYNLANAQPRMSPAGSAVLCNAHFVSKILLSLSFQDLWVNARRACKFFHQIIETHPAILHKTFRLDANNKLYTNKKSKAKYEDIPTAEFILSRLTATRSSVFGQPDKYGVPGDEDDGDYSIWTLSDCDYDDTIELMCQFYVSQPALKKVHVQVCEGGEKSTHISVILGTELVDDNGVSVQQVMDVLNEQIHDGEIPQALFVDYDCIYSAMRADIENSEGWMCLRFVKKFVVAPKPQCTGDTQNGTDGKDNLVGGEKMASARKGKKAVNDGAGPSTAPAVKKQRRQRTPPPKPRYDGMVEPHVAALAAADYGNYIEGVPLTLGPNARTEAYMSSAYRVPVPELEQNRFEGYRHHYRQGFCTYPYEGYDDDVLE